MALIARSFVLGGISDFSYSEWPDPRIVCIAFPLGFTVKGHLTVAVTRPVIPAAVFVVPSVGQRVAVSTTSTTVIALAQIVADRRCAGSFTRGKRDWLLITTIAAKQGGIREQFSILIQSHLDSYRWSSFHADSESRILHTHSGTPLELRIRTIINYQNSGWTLCHAYNENTKTVVAYYKVYPVQGIRLPVVGARSHSDDCGMAPV